MPNKMEFCRCRFTSLNGDRCPNEAREGGLCFWHDPKADKTGDDVKDKLEAYVKGGGFTRGMQLHHAKLDGIDLVNRGSKSGYDFSESDFYHASVEDAHCFNICLYKASLMKASFCGSNLHFANLTDANLLGIKLHNARIDHMQISKRILQEQQAKEAHRRKDKAMYLDYLEQAEEIYRDLRKAAEKQGLVEYSGRFIHRELTMRRLQKPLFSWQRFISKVVDLFCGYGEKPLNVVLFSMMLITVCAILYFAFGVRFSDEIIAINPSQGLWENFKLFLSSMYFSVVTFTTLGYGDITPVGPSRVIAAIEAFVGSFTLALFVVVFVKKMTR